MNPGTWVKLKPWVTREHLEAIGLGGLNSEMMSALRDRPSYVTREFEDSYLKGMCVGLILAGQTFWIKRCYVAECDPPPKPNTEDPFSNIRYGSGNVTVTLGATSSFYYTTTTVT